MKVLDYNKKLSFLLEELFVFSCKIDNKQCLKFEIELTKWIPLNADYFQKYVIILGKSENLIELG
jgi:hypothetical protein